MGKTTFMINLYLAYKNQFTWFGLKPYLEIKLFPLGSPDTLKAVKKIENKKNAILLLDAFDEDVNAVADHKARMKEILSIAKEFREIVITCRTQFFPTEEEVPTEAGYIKTYGDSETEYKFQKLYLSVFDEKDIKRYLRKRFSIFQFSKRKKAKTIVEKSPNLVMRPMLLSYINDLVGESRDFKYSYEVYEVLIKKWIERESKKHGVREKYGSAEYYQKLLYDFSYELAINLYQNKEKRGGHFIKHDENLSTQLQLNDVEKYDESERDLKGKSLLNRNAQGQYKFSHKSIFEYFLAKRCFADDEFLNKFNFSGMSAASNFYREMIFENLIKLEGHFYLVDGTGEIFLSSLKKFPELTFKSIWNYDALKITSIENLNITFLSNLINLKELIIYDKKNLVGLYELYLLFRYGISNTELQELQELPERLLPGRSPVRGDLRELPEWLERLELRELPELQERLERRELLQLLEPTELLELLKLLSTKSHVEIQEDIKPINDFLKEMKELERKLPNCKIYY